MRWILLIILAVTFPVTVAAQDCPDGTAEGTSPVDAPCKLCLNGVLEPLPPRTTCGDEVRFGCDANGAFRDECVYVDPPNGEETVCETAVPKGPACPSGLTCDDTEGLCRLFCDDASDCQDGFDCDEQRCVAIPPPDMGMPPGDLGVPPSDMGSPDMGSSDMGVRDMGGRPDMEPGSDGGAETGIDPDSDGGCCAVVAGSSDSELAFLFLVALTLVRRRHA